MTLEEIEKRWKPILASNGPYLVYATNSMEIASKDIHYLIQRVKELEEGIKIWKLNGDYDLTYGPDRDLIKLIDKEGNDNI